MASVVEKDAVCAICRYEFDSCDLRNPKIRVKHINDPENKIDHCFHKNCIGEHLKYSRGKICPLDRQPIEHVPSVDSELARAVESRDEQLINYFLQTGLVSEAGRGCATLKAVSAGVPSLVAKLLMEGSISSEDRFLGLCLALREHKTGLAHQLLDSGPLTAEDRREAFLLAKRNGYLQISKRLSDSSCTLL